MMPRWYGRARMIRRHRAVACALAVMCIPVYCAVYIYFHVANNTTHANDNLSLPPHQVTHSLTTRPVHILCINVLINVQYMNRTRTDSARARDTDR